MKLPSAILCVILSMGVARAVDKTTVLSFDDLSVGFDHIPMPEGYGSLQWSNFRVVNGWNQPWNSGYRTGMVSVNNVAFNPFGNPAALSATNLFDLDSAYLTAGVLDGLQLEVQGYVGTTLAYDNTYTLNLTAPMLINFNYRGVDQVKFIPSPMSQFVMDHLTVTFPGPNTNGNCAFDLAPRSRLHGAGSETGSVSVTAPDGCTWSVSNSNAWVTITSSLNNSNSGVVTYMVAANPTATARDGFINIAGQPFALSQSGDPSANAQAPVDLGVVQPSTIGHSFLSTHIDPFPFPQMPNSVADFLIDQDQSSGGGSVLQPNSVNWDTNSQFVLTVSAPPGQKFLVQVPPGREASFGGSLFWESTRGGSSPIGPVTVRFGGLEGRAPDFLGSDAVLSASHGYFGFSEITSSTFSGELAFTSISFTGNASPQYTGLGTEDYVLHQESSLQIFYTTSDSTDPGPFVSLVTTAAPAPRIRVAAVSPSTGVMLFVQGQAGRTNVVEGSEDMVHWMPISTNVMPFAVCPACPYVRVTDAAATNMVCRIYRALELR